MKEEHPREAPQNEASLQITFLYSMMNEQVYERAETELLNDATHSILE